MPDTVLDTGDTAGGQVLTLLQAVGHMVTLMMKLHLIHLNTYEYCIQRLTLIHAPILQVERQPPRGLAARENSLVQNGSPGPLQGEGVPLLDHQ